ncbi:very short patch repair endonuclease [Thioalkalivibrio sp. ALR17-21]|uniref:very short patch repair endonuclease n=1 Tax=Thioalkalivibrio sp. ALR17-21 TaxID=1269813 RepID=UPI000408ECB0|nr:very short patch repair endonuclease [Thioalkalivibrio sp. ALR17-21]
MDVVDAKTRSRMMSGIRSTNTRPEMRVRRFLHSRGFRYRLHQARLPGSPDLVLRKHSLAIFIHGCFWHRHRGCRLTTTPSTNPEKWQKKFSQNVARDQRNQEQLLTAGWRVLILWECGLRGSDMEAMLDQWLPGWITGDEPFLEWPEKETPAT